MRCQKKKKKTSAKKTRRQNRRDTQSETSENSYSPSIPVDVLIEIFLTLSVKSIATCRCVSKLWCSTLRRQDFTELFLSSSYSRSPKLLFACIKYGDLLFFSSTQPQNPDENSSPVVASRHVKFSFNVSIDMNDISFGVHGFVCLLSYRISRGNKEIAPVLWNSSTGQVVFLSKVMTRKGDTVKCFLGYDPIGKKFKALSMKKQVGDVSWDQHQVLTVGTGGKSTWSWRTIECSIPHHYALTEPICINGVLYYISTKWSTKTCVIVCFDVRSESFSCMKAKGALNEALLNGGTLVNYNGKLGCVVQSGLYALRVRFDGKSKSFKLWVLEDVEKQEWSERIYIFPAVWKNVVGEYDLSFVGVTRTNEIVFSPLSPAYPFYLYYLNLERNTVVRVRIQGLDTSNCDLCFTSLNHLEDVKLYGKC
ncbi:unnamed protein product [Microthlaspi erraticum]|uniref:F-box domain-containing protein n=1 Tax=Microthlaspi erraticum TaxID=1685480 RepID=A0A6D2JRV6_9BRAS|nr:unnamed protein product [Microthlaspi erraticum]